MTFTMTVDCWRRFIAQLREQPHGSSYPGADMANKIRAAINMVEQKQLVPKDLSP